MAEKLSSIDEYLEKVAQGGLAKYIIGPLQAAGKFIKSPVGIATTIGAGGLGALGAWHAMGGGRPGDTLSYRINRELHGLVDRIRADEVFGEAFAKELGSSTSKELIGLTKDIVTKGYETAKDALATSPARSAIFESLQKEDDILAMADKGMLQEAYHTMARFAPTLSTDKNAVKSFLRTAVASAEGGADFNTIKLLAEAENAVQGWEPRGKKG